MAEVTVVIAAHDPRRQLARAVRSVLAQGPQVQVMVVAHNCGAAQIDSQIPDDPRVSVVALDDGVRSPSGPFNLGMRQADTEWVSIMGSDDELQPGAVRGWLHAASRHAHQDLQVDAVICAVRRGTGPVRSPMVRPWRRGLADPVRDRLYYRSAPLGLIRAGALADLGLELLPGAQVGGDLPFVVRLWSRGQVALALKGPGYLEHNDAPSRVTTAALPMQVQHRALLHVLEFEFDALTPRQQQSLSTKLLRRNIIDSVRKLDRAGSLQAPYLPEMHQVIEQILRREPTAANRLSRAEFAVIDQVLTPSVDPRQIHSALARMDHRLHPQSWLSHRPHELLDSQAPLRYTLAAALLG